MSDDTTLHGEEAVLADYLGHFRRTFERICQGLDADQLARRSVPPSSMSLLGLLRHLAAVEYSWWRRVMGHDLTLPKMWGKDENRDADFDGAIADEAVVAEAWEAWRAEVAHAEEFRATHPMDFLGQHDDGPIEMREVVVHLIEEYARHCGHADLLRETIDGQTGR
ncbi:DinB family protein [Nocardioides sp. HB32]